MPESSLHGTLVRVHDRGVLIRGAPGSGKSRLALELIHHGHALVADDLVLARVIDNHLSGRAAGPQQGVLALRGVGMLDVAEVYGAECTHPAPQFVDWLVELGAAPPQPLPEHDFTEVLGCRLPRLRLQPNSRDATLVALCCRLGSNALHRWKLDDVDEYRT